MLSKKDIENLMELLMLDPDITLEGLFQTFIKKYNSEYHNLFRPCSLCLCLLKENLITEQQRLTSIFLIMESYKNDQKANPFIANLIDVILQYNDQYEAKLFQRLYSSNLKEKEQFSKQQLGILFQEKDSHKYVASTVYQDKIKEIKAKYIDSLPRNLLAYNYGTTNILCDFNLSDDLQNFPPQVSILPEQLNLCEQDCMLFMPDTLRPIPQSEDLGIDEEEWLNPSLVTEHLWDYKICEPSDKKILLQEILIKAYETKLNDLEYDLFKKELEQDDVNIRDLELNTELLPKLVENNNKIASLLLIKIAKEKELTQYLEKISTLDLTLQSLEVVNDLINNVNLPKEFIYLYVSNIIQQCDENKKEKNQHQRLVRLVCVFIRQLIKSQSINPKENFIELQAFSIENSKIPEATTLFKLLKDLDNEPNNNNHNNNYH
ncbi:ubiquitin family protein, putative (macronuclear) [Tetrahymena thermophila SB210]|uniref:CCR4-NOT transcription complex subunit 11 n=1 Tax=Tetrahymena thermophila (strain SB210) TaxID=312017 RepID=I7MHW5_TETTS|nr:ubiquitin family protein, putative [Tetrahymena thermophila SB210]EAS03673.2 ubiquitin family protein, putative [Tetrahymena thermophila SB210]|eukprot:XP_001023918.2 ubiquitin family protein, putative [Tetrahymena thermophila SB210]